MKEYKKPMLYAESYALAEHISQSCAYQTNFGNQCPISDAGVVFFTRSNETCAASEDGQSMISFAGLDPENVTVEQIINVVKPTCYNSLQDYHQLFTS